MQKSTSWLGRKLSWCLLAVVAGVVVTSSANAGPVPIPETSGGSAELLAVLGMVAVAFMLRKKKNTAKLPM
jgi:hypothetical protein